MRTRFCAVAALLALLGTSGLSCFVPHELLGADQSECCRQMGSQCGSKDMSSPQSCCKSPSQQSVQPYLSSGVHPQLGPSAVVAAFLPVGPTPNLLVALSIFNITQYHSPPLSLPETTSVIRV
jgi:hypothetical protein